MARALIVGCGCRGRALGRRLTSEGWQVRGTTREPGQLETIRSEGLEGAVADPDRAGTIVDLIRDVTLLFWLMGSAVGEPQAIAAIHGPRLERVLEKIVDSPVRGFVYEAGGPVSAEHRERGAEIVREAERRWRIPVAVVEADPERTESWTAAMLAAAGRLTTAGRPALERPGY